MFNFLKTGYDKIKKALSKTRSALSGRIQALFGKPWTDDTFEELEQILFEADLGGQCAGAFVEHLRSSLRTKPTNDISTILSIFHDYAITLLNAAKPTAPKASVPGEPYVILIV